jgi:hypothetical protein
MVVGFRRRVEVTQGYHRRRPESRGGAAPGFRRIIEFRMRRAP